MKTRRKTANKTTTTPDLPEVPAVPTSVGSVLRALAGSGFYAVPIKECAGYYQLDTDDKGRCALIGGGRHEIRVGVFGWSASEQRNNSSKPKPEELISDRFADRPVLVAELDPRTDVGPITADDWKVVTPYKQLENPKLINRIRYVLVRTEDLPRIGILLPRTVRATVADKVSFARIAPRTGPLFTSKKLLAFVGTLTRKLAQVDPDDPEWNTSIYQKCARMFAAKIADLGPDSADAKELLTLSDKWSATYPEFSALIAVPDDTDTPDKA